MQTLPEVDAVVVGMGWTGGIVAKELADAGLTVVGLERGGPRTTGEDFAVPHIRNELAYGVRLGLMQDVSRDTLTFRNNAGQRALPMRRLGSFLPGEGVGGSGAHWNGLSWRWTDHEFRIRSRYTERHGAGFIPDDMTIQDWGLTETELEPYFEKFERTAAVSGRAGNLRGRIQPGGNPFEAARRSAYPLPPLHSGLVADVFSEAATAAGHHPFPVPVANASEAYVNPDGIAFGQCQYCGFCDKFGCEANAKGSPHLTVVASAQRRANFTLRTHARVMRIRTDRDGKQATGVEYLDLRSGQTVFQPAAMVVLGAYTFGNVHLMLTSGIGEAYDPVTGKGQVGRNYAYNLGVGARLFFEDKIFNPFIGAGGSYAAIDDFNNNWSYDRGPDGFVGGILVMAGMTNGRPIEHHPVPPGTPRWGSEWKAAMAHWYQKSMSIGGIGSIMPSRRNHLDLDPDYRDPFGQPMLRMTFDYTDNDRRLTAKAAQVVNDLARSLSPSHLVPAAAASRSYTIAGYQGTHNSGGTIMSPTPESGVVNKFGQCWTMPNLFVVGASTMPHNGAQNPTATIGAMAYLTADAIRRSYLPHPNRLLAA